MPTRETRRDAADRETRAMLVRLGMECRDARIGAGVSLATVRAVCDLSASEVSRLERAPIANASLLELNRLARASGQRLSVKLYPGDDPIRDVAHARLIERLRQRTHPRFHWRTEAPLPGESTLRGVGHDAHAGCRTNGDRSGDPDPGRSGVGPASPAEAAA